MGYRREDIRVELENGYWADIAAQFRLAWDKHLLDLAKDESRSAEMGTEVLLLAIQRWNITDDDGTPLPVTAESIEQLYEDDATTLLKRVTELRRGRSASEQADFTELSTPGREDGATVPPPGSNG